MTSTLPLSSACRLSSEPPPTLSEHFRPNKASSPPEHKYYKILFQFFTAVARSMCYFGEWKRCIVECEEGVVTKLFLRGNPLLSTTQCMKSPLRVHFKVGNFHDIRLFILQLQKQTLISKYWFWISTNVFTYCCWMDSYINCNLSEAK